MHYSKENDVYEDDGNMSNKYMLRLTMKTHCSMRQFKLDYKLSFSCALLMFANAIISKYLNPLVF